LSKQTITLNVYFHKQIRLSYRLSIFLFLTHIKTNVGETKVDLEATKNMPVA